MKFRTLAITLGAIFAALTSAAHATNYYVDPATGNMTNPGTSAQPWSTLQAVFAAGKTFVAGDTIYLRSGYHGTPTITGNNTGVVTITNDTGAAPKFEYIKVNNASQWVINGVDVCPNNAGAGVFVTSIDLFSVAANCSYITIQNCTVEATASIAGYTQTQWEALGTHAALSSSAPHTTFYNDVLTNVGFGLVLGKTAQYSLISHCTVQEFYEDGSRGLADDMVYEYNTIKDSYVSDSNHDDCFQSWSLDANNVVGNGTVYRCTIRNNLFLSKTDPNQPLAAAPQGMGNFDGMFDSWVVENNIVSSQTYHGLSLYGATNCKIINNTVLENPLDPSNGTVKPWVLITSHKNQADGTPWPVANANNEVRNNITSNGASVVGGVADHNVTIHTAALYASYFNNYPGFDFTLSPTSPAINAGSDTDAPTADFDDRPRISPTDIGAFEYESVIFEPFNYAATTNVSTAPDSPSDTGFTGTTWSGTNDIITPGLSYSGLPTSGNALQFTANVAADRSIDMTRLPAGFTQVDGDGVTRLGKPGTTLWFRCLLRCDVDDTTNTKTGELQLLGAASGGTDKISMGATGTGANWGLSIYGTPVFASLSSVPIVTGQTVLLVMKIQYVAGTNNDIVSLYVNPPLTTSAPATPDATITGRDIGTFDRVEFKGTRLTTGDEVSIATDWGFLF